MATIEIRRQFITAIVVNLLGFSVGWMMSWPNANFLELQSKDTILTDGPITPNEAGLVMSLICVGGLIGNIMYLWILETFGRKYPIWFLSIPMTMSWVLIIYAKNAHWLYASRILAGFATSSFFISSPVFVSEICSDNVRGSVNVLNFFFMTLGSLFGFIVANFMDFRMQAVCAVSIPIVFAFVFLFVPESPEFLYRKNKIEAADRSFEFYKGRLVVPETEKILFEQNNNERPAESGITISDFFGTRSARRGVYISLILTVLQQLCGFYTLLSYTTSFFEEAGSSLTPLQSSTLICVVQLVANISTMFLIDRLGRKILFISSSIGTGLGLLTLALHHLFKAELPECKWLPIYALSFTVFIAQAGLLSLPMIITIDVLPIKIRNITMTIGSLITWVLGFFMNIAYLYMLDQIELHGCLIVLCIACFICALYALIFIPETKGKSYEEVAELLES